jgi:hypothetical protein
MACAAGAFPEMGMGQAADDRLQNELFIHSGFFHFSSPVYL